MKLKSDDKYFGWIVEEGLIDPFSLSELKIKYSNVGLERGRDKRAPIYHVYGVTMKGSEVEKLTKLLHHKYHYAKFFHGDEVIMVFPNQICIVNYKTKQGLKEAKEYAKKLQIVKTI